MNLSVIGTGSAGNCYLLEADGDSLLLDAGMRWDVILSALPEGIRNVRGCLVTHEHKDHSKSVNQMLMRGIKVALSKRTWEAMNSSSKFNALTAVNRLVFVSEGQSLQFSPFTVVAVKAMHDAAEPLAFLIRHDPTMETVLYATDTYMLPNRYPSINHWLVECNYTMEKAKTLLEEPEKAPLYNRLMESHMSLERLCTALEANDLRHTRTIVLIHISNDRGDSPLMQETVQRITGVRTIAAQNGTYIKLGECPF